jgi:predicted Na+-dependent transporter
MLPLLNDIANLAIWIFVVTSIAAMGLQLTVREIVAPFKKKWLITISLAANFVIIPLFAVFILRVFPLDPGLSAGLLIVATAAGAPSLPKAMEIIGGNVAYAVGLTILLILITIFYMPLVLPLLISGVLVDQTSTALYLIAFMLVPLVFCMMIRARRQDTAEFLYPFVDRISNIAILFIFIPYLIGLLTSDFSARAGAELGIEGIFVALLFILGAFGIGYLLGGPEMRDREVLAFGTGFRNVSAALIVVTANYPDPKIIFMVLVIAIFGIICMMFLGGLLYRKNKRLEHSGKTGELME